MWSFPLIPVLIIPNETRAWGRLTIIPEQNTQWGTQKKSVKSPDFSSFPIFQDGRAPELGDFQPALLQTAPSFQEQSES